jgi:nucleotide-binding universal stress UspA family protein
VQRLQQVLYLERHPGGFGRAFACALRVARDHGASLTVAAAPEDFGARGRPALPGDRRILAERVRLARARGVDARLGTVDPDVLRASSEHDLLMTVARRDSLRWPLRFAPGERALLHRCGCPTWILHPVQGPRLRTVVAGVDVSAESDDAWNRRILDAAACLARGAGAKLYVVHAWTLLGESLLRSRNRGGSRQTVRRLLADTAADRQRRVERLLDGLDSEFRPRVLLRKGRTVASLEDVAWRRQADLVVVGSSDREGLGTLVFPTTAEQLLGRVPGSVVTVHPPANAHAPTAGRTPAHRTLRDPDPSPAARRLA